MSAGIPSLAQQLASVATNRDIDTAIIQALEQRPMVVKDLAAAIEVSVQQANGHVIQLLRSKRLERRSRRHRRDDGQGYRTVWRYKIRKQKAL